MPRRARVPSKTGYYHLILRGNNRDYIFKHSRNKQFYREQLFRYQSEGSYSLSAWCIMDNYVHLVLYSSDLKDLSMSLHDLNLIYAQYCHREQKSIGHVFQDRFKSENVEDDGYLKQVIRYVHKNTVKAKMVRNLDDYKWSSFNDYKNNVFSESMRFSFSLFDNHWGRFREYYQQEDEREFLEIKEDQEKYRREKAQKIIANVCQAHGI